MTRTTAKKDLFETYSTTKVLVQNESEVIYEGRDAKRQRPVMIRIAELPENPFQILQNLSALNAASHPSLPRVLDFGTDDGCFYLVVEAVKGRDLDSYDAYLASLASPQRRVRALAQVFLQVAWALEALHENGLTAGEIAPRKIVVNDAGRGHLLVSDVLEKPTGDREFAPVSTDLREFAGLVYRTLCGVPFDPANPDPTELQPALTPRFNSVFAKALGGDPDTAYVTARELALDLSHAVASL